MPYFAGRMLASKIADSARNSSGKIFPSLFGNSVAIDNKFLGNMPCLDEGTGTEETSDQTGGGREGTDFVQHISREGKFFVNTQY